MLDLDKRSITYLPGVGPKKADILQKEAGISSYEDLLFYFPYKYIDRSRFYKVVEISDGFTGADLESTVRDLAYRSIANANFILSEENIVTAFNNVVPLSQTSPEKIEAIRDWGKERAVPASGKPIGGEELIQKKSGPKTRKVLV